MKKVFRYFTMMLAIGGATLTSCLDKEEIVNNQKEQYQDNWVKVFGNIDPDHDWSVAKQVNATFNLAGVVSGEHTARIYTEHPYNKKCKLLAEFKVNGSGTVSFDTEKTTKHVYIRVENAEGQMAFDGYFTIEGNELIADSRTIAARSLSRATPNTNYFTEHQVGSTLRDGQNEENEISGNNLNAENHTVNLGTIYYPTSAPITEDVTIGFNDYLIPIVHTSNSDAIFEEFKDNRTKTSTQGVEYITITDGPVALDYIFGVTGLYNTIGYFYWNPDNGTTYTDAPKIVLIEDARPDVILKGISGDGNEISFSSGTALYDYILGNQNLYQLKGKKYNLLYYGEDYQSEGTTDFPAGTHIGFFLYTSYWDKNKTGSSDSPYSQYGDLAYGRPNPKDVTGQSQYIRTLLYSIPEYNLSIKESYNYRINPSTYQGNNKTLDTSKGEVSAVTYSYQGKKILGFEDGVDKDMNDILFVVNADVEVAGGELVQMGGSNNTPQAQSWLIACEDLGSIGDYDFNDAVFSVSHVGGSDTLTVTPLAAGGTYPIALYYNGVRLEQNGESDFHLLVNENTQANNGLWEPVNVEEKGTPGQSITITTGVPKNYSINQHGFSVVVTNEYNGESVTIKQSQINDKEQKAPQMLILPGNWIWPKELKSILSCYPRFADWNANSKENLDWYAKSNEGNEINEDDLVARYEDPGNGSGGTGGEEIPDVDNPSATTYNIPITVDGVDKGSITTKNDGNNYLELPKEYFAGSGTIQITLNGMSAENQNIALFNNNDAWKAGSDSNTLTIEASAIADSNNLRIYIWQNSTNNFDDITSITITNNYQGGNEEPETNGITVTVDGVEKSDLQIVQSNLDLIKIPAEYFDAGNNGATITFTSTSPVNPSGQDGQGGIVGADNNPNISNGEITISEADIDKNRSGDITESEGGKYVVIFLPQNNTYGITAISIMNLNSGEQPTTKTVELTVDGVAKNALTLEGSEGSYYVTIPAGTFGNYGATIEFTSSDQNSQIQNVTVDEQNGYTTVTNNNGYLKIEVPSNMVNSSTATEIRIPNTVTSIVITNKENTSSVGGITFTVDGVAKSNLTLEPAANGQNPYIEIPKSHFGSNGTTITFTSTEDLAGQLDHNSGSISIDNNSISVPSNTYQYLPDPVKVQVWNGATSITAISITNESGDDNPGESGDNPTADYGTSINFTKDNNYITISESQLNDITTGSKLYFLDENNKTIEVNHNITTNISGVVLTYNNNSNPYTFTADNVNVIDREDFEYIKMEFWNDIPTKIYLKIAE